MKKTTLFFLVLFIILILTGIILLNRRTELNSPLPDFPCGSVTAPCSQGVPEGNEDWVTFKDEMQNLSFRYPGSLGLTYIHQIHWPPEIKKEGIPFSCSGEMKAIEGESYCVKEIMEGAAGSTYTTYNYSRTFQKPQQTLTLNFILQGVQCLNYDDPQKTECEKERQDFNVDKLADQIMRSVTFLDSNQAH